MKRSEQDKLFSELLGGNGLSNLRERSLNAGLQSLRRRKRVRRTLRVCAVLLAPLLAAGWLALDRGASPPSPEPMIVAGDSGDGVKDSLPPETARPDSRMKIISDEELLALFPNRPLALVGRPGQQQLIFLDEIGDVETWEREY